MQFCMKGYGRNAPGLSSYVGSLSSSRGIQFICHLQLHQGRTTEITQCLNNTILCFIFCWIYIHKSNKLVLYLRLCIFYVTINIFHTGLFFRNSNFTHTMYYSIVRTTDILEFEIDFRPLGRIRRGRLRGTYLTWWYGGYQNQFEVN